MNPYKSYYLNFKPPAQNHAGRVLLLRSAKKAPQFFWPKIDRPNECGLYVNEREENGSHMEAILVVQTGANRLP